MNMFNDQSWMSRKCLNKIYYLLSLYFIYVVLIAQVIAAKSTQCNYEGSGLDGNEKEVQSVYLSCRGGRVRWIFPRGALRINIRSPDHREFRGCIKSSMQSAGARIFLEGHRTLIRVYPEDGPSKNSTRCFVSYQSQISFYVEASPSEKFEKLTTFFEYHLESLVNDDYDTLDECQPCSSLQMLRTYCSADFAAKGTFIRSEDNNESEQTIITFAAARVFQQNPPIFVSSGQSEETGFQNANKVPANMEMTYVGRFRVPIKCEASIGAGEYVVMGTMRLGEPLLKCAASIEDWRTLVRYEQQNAHCILEQ